MKIFKWAGQKRAQIAGVSPVFARWILRMYCIGSDYLKGQALFSSNPSSMGRPYSD